MRFLLYIAQHFLFFIISPSLDYDKEYDQLKKYELIALKKQRIGKEHIYDLTGKRGCNKTKIKYLGIIKTNSGKQYKLLTSFFVYSAASTCHGTSNIKVYNIKNNFIGKYTVGMPDELPFKIGEDKLIYWNNSQECSMKKTFTINCENGLPKTIFIPCTKDHGNEYYFNTEKAF
jgi:hypothetical protein